MRIFISKSFGKKQEKPRKKDMPAPDAFNAGYRAFFAGKVLEDVPDWHIHAKRFWKKGWKIALKEAKLVRLTEYDD